VRIGLLGTLAVHDEAGRPVRVGGYRVRLLLTLLALDPGRVVPAHSLIDRLWDDPPANSGNSLQSLVSRLRASLRQAGLSGQAIESHPVGYRLAVPPQDVDTVAFETLARQGAQALAAGDPVTANRVLTEALRLWRGPALADASGAEFAAGPAARLEELRSRAALDLIEAGLALGESDTLTGELRAMIAADPVAERPRGLLMRALYAAGRQAEALAVYAETRDLLASQLGVDPSPQLEEIYLGVLRQDLALPTAQAVTGTGDMSDERSEAATPAFAPRAAVVRKPLTSFVGRDEDVTRVRKMLSEGRLVTLTGPGGAGKTRLAVETAGRLAADRPVWFVELGPVTEPSEVPYAVLDALGIRETPVLARAGAGQATPGPAQRLVAALGDRPGLLILDNCEHVIEAAAALTDEILAGCSSARVLATSREPLRIAGEALWPVPPLPVPPTGGDRLGGSGAGGAAADGGGPGETVAGDGVVAGYASVRLLADRAAAVRPGFTVDASNAADVARICRALDGMPLAIELAAARLRTLSAAQLAERLDARFELLTGGSRTAVPRHQTLRAVVDWSWDLLSGPEQVLARRLAVFPGGATLAAAEQVCQDAALPAASVLPALFGLVEKSFLAVVEDGESRYRMLETVRAYCAGRLAEAGEDEQARRAFTDHFLRLAETADPLLRTGQQPHWMRRLRAELDNVNAAVRWAIDRREVGMALRFALSLGWFWLLRGQRRESAALAREILAISEQLAAGGDLLTAAGDDLLVVQARAICAVTAVNASWDMAEARRPLLAAEALLRSSQADEPVHPLVIVGVAIFMLYEKRDPQRAFELLAAHFSSPDPWTRAGTRLMYGFLAMSAGRPHDVAEHLSEGLAAFQAIGDRWGIAMALMGQAELASFDGDHARAIAALEEAVDQTRAMTDWQETAQIFASMARHRSRVSDHQGALADIARAERIACVMCEPESDLWVSFIRAELAWLRGDFAETSRICRGLDSQIASKPGTMSWSYRALVQARWALADLRAGKAAEGRGMLASALHLAAESQDRSALAAVIDGAAAAALAAGDSRTSAERAATLLGAAHSVRGAFDHSSLDAPGTRDIARGRLGEAAFDTAYRRGQALGVQDAAEFATAVVKSARHGGPGAPGPEPGSGPAPVGTDRQRREHAEDAERPQQ
jgi:predicted ATPase/DNA-binding SARP family transcriptional activator